MASRLGRVLRSSLPAVRSITTDSAPRPPVAFDHDYAKPCGLLGSWEGSNDPKEAERKLARLRREYAKAVKEKRREFAYEMELQRQEKLGKDEARREAARVANDERKATKAAAAKVAAEERKAFLEDFRQTLLKERAQKLESFRMKEELREKKKSEKNELLRRQSSMWIGENELKQRISELVDYTTPL